MKLRVSMGGVGLGGLSVMAAACGGAAPAPGAAPPQAPEMKHVAEVGGFKMPGGIPDITGFPVYIPPDDKEKDVKNYKRGGTFNYVSLDPPHLDIGLTSSCTVYNVADMVYNKLVRAKIGPNADPFRVELTSDLAKSWEVSKDGLVYTFHLNQGVKWQNLPPVNGRELTAEDVKWNFEEYSGGIQRATFDNVANIEAPDKYTVKVTLKEPNVDFVASLAAMAFIRPKEIKDADGSFRQKAIGTGPFVMDKWTPKQGLNYSRNAAYWEKDAAGNPLPYLDKANMFVISDTGAARAAYRSGQVDVLRANTVAEAQEVKKSDADTVFMSNASGMVRGNTGGLLYRADRPPLNDVRVRRALSMGIDRPTISDTLYGGVFAMSLGMPWVYFMDNVPTLKDFGPYFQYNPTEAKKLLVEAGYPNGLTVEMVDWYFRIPADSVIAMLKEIGVTVKRREVDNPTQVTIITKGEYGDMTAAAWYIPGYDVDSEIYPFLHSKGAKNYGLYKDPEMDKLLEAQRREPDVAKRKTILKQIWDRQLDQVPVAWIPNARVLYGWRSYAKNYRSHGIMSDTNCYATGNLNRVVWLDK
ncbi:MAG: ABC transporter substrate-binding protein [Chloroflexi bacterium]|nr:ABC transporter substrate-binding protein [Chloroflexota bacterium]